MARRFAGWAARLERNLSGRGNKNRRDFVGGMAVMGTAQRPRPGPGVSASSLTSALHSCLPHVSWVVLVRVYGPG